MTHKTKHLNDWKDYSSEEICAIYDLAVNVSEHRWAYQGYLSGRSVALLFQKTSTRTRVSFEAGINELGGHSIFLDWKNTNFSVSDISYEGKYLSRNSAAILARMMRNSDFLELAKYSEVSVINGCCDRYHPCQAFADLVTIMTTAEKHNLPKPYQICYSGVYNNVVNSLVSISKAFPVHFTLVCPEIDFIDEESLNNAKAEGKVTLLESVSDLEKSVKTAHFVYTDTWINMELFDDPNKKEENAAKVKKMLPYQISETLMKGSNAFVMHDMPIHAGYEISGSMVTDPRSIIFEQAERRLEAQKAILLHLVCPT